MISQELLSMVIGLFVSVLVVDTAIAQNIAELNRTYDAYNAAAKTGDVDKILSMYTAKTRKDIQRGISKKEDRDFFIIMKRAEVPESYEVQHTVWDRNGKSGTLYLVAQLPAMPEIERPRMRMEMMVTFIKEKGKWKIDLVTPLVDLDNIKRPKDLTFNPDDADTEKFGYISGRIIKTEFKEGYTLVILRVMDEEHAVFLAAKKVLLKAEVPLDDLNPWNMHEFGGHPHKSDNLKFFAKEGKRIEN